jgi:hypothetical protein
VLIIGVALPLGFWIDHRSWSWEGICLLVGMGTLAGWLVVLLVRKLLGKQLSMRGKPIGYFVAFTM